MSNVDRLAVNGEEAVLTSINVHVFADTRLEASLTLGTPTLSIGKPNEPVTIFLNDTALARLLDVLRTLEREKAEECPVHGQTCRPVWHKHVSPA